MRNALFSLGLCGGLVLLLPVSAHGHLVDTRCGPFYDGLCHPFATPTDLMIVLAMSLLAGYAGPALGRTTLFSLTTGWLAGAIIGYAWLSSSFAMPVAVAAVSNLLVALMVVANLRCPRALFPVLGATLGLCFGLSNGAEFGTVNDGPLALAGNVSCVFALTTWVTALAVKNDEGWRRIVVRVAGSWIAAASLLMVGWELRGAFS